MIDYADPSNLLSRVKAIRAKCEDCMCGQMAEVSRCNITTCPLWPYRMGGGRPRWQNLKKRANLEDDGEATPMVDMTGGHDDGKGDAASDGDTAS